MRSDLGCSSAECLKRWRYNGAIITAASALSLFLGKRPFVVFVSSLKANPRVLGGRTFLSIPSLSQKWDVRRRKRRQPQDRAEPLSRARGKTDSVARAQTISQGIIQGPCWRDFYLGLLERVFERLFAKGERKEEKKQTPSSAAVYFTGESMQAPEILTSCFLRARNMFAFDARARMSPPHRRILSDPKRTDSVTPPSTLVDSCPNTTNK